MHTVNVYVDMYGFLKHKLLVRGILLNNCIDVDFKEALYRIWFYVNRLGDSGVNRLGDTSAFVNTSGKLLLSQRGKTRMDGVGIVFEFYTAPL